MLWKNHFGQEANWETEEAMRAKYPQLFETPGKKISFPTIRESNFSNGEDIIPKPRIT